MMAKGDQPVAPPVPTPDEVLAAKKVKKAPPKPVPSALEEKPEPIPAAKTASDTGSSAAAKPRAARPQPVAAKKAASDAKGKAEAKSEAKPKATEGTQQGCRHAGDESFLR